jgi:hypothetical protein
MSEPQRPQDATVEELSTPPEYRPMPSAPDLATNDATTLPAATSSRRAPIRWIVALVGVLVVAAGSFLIVSLAGGRPAVSATLGYMPGDVAVYSEVRLDLPGDQRQKLASFLHTGKFPGFADQAQIQPKIEDVFDRIVRFATHDKQTFTGNIEPWFGGQLAFGQALPSSIPAGAGAMSAADRPLLGVATVTDRAKAAAWVASLSDPSSLNRSTYNGADYFTSAGSAKLPFAIAVTDKVLLGGTEAEVKAAVDSNGNGPLASNADVKAALATVDQDYVVLSLSRTRAMVDTLAKLVSSAKPGVLDQTQIDDTLIAMLPSWQVSTMRFEDDAISATGTGPSWNIGFDAKNEPSDLLGHVPANAIAYIDGHDAGPAYNAILARFRALPETKPFFDQYDQALSLLGGNDAVTGWWGDTALVIAPNADNTIGGGLLIHPRDAGAADRLLSTLKGFIQLGGASLGLSVRDEDHNGTKITIVWASNQDVAVIGYGRDFVASVLDAGPGHSLADDARFKAGLSRVGAENIATSFVDITAIRKLVEPLVQAEASPDDWARYTKDIQPYLAPFDVVIGATRKDGANDHSTSLVTVH